MWALAFVLISSFSHAYPLEWKSTPFKGSVVVQPTTTKSRGSIIILHGSEGGSMPYIDAEASILATMGYSVLEYCYFDCDRGITGPRKTLKDVEVTKILDAVQWLRKQPHSNGKVVVYGFSRGAELAMIVGALPMTRANAPDGLIAHSPSDVYNGAWNWSWREMSCWTCKLAQCKEQNAYTWNKSCGPDDPRTLDQKASAWTIGGMIVPAEKRIEIENYTRPILITVGLSDEVWPVEQTKRIEATLVSRKRALEIHYFKDAKHVFVGRDEQLRRDYVLAFLKRTL